MSRKMMNRPLVMSAITLCKKEPTNRYTLLLLCGSWSYQVLLVGHITLARIPMSVTTSLFS